MDGQASAAPRVYTAVLYTQQLGFIAAPPLGASWRGTSGRAAVGFLRLRGKFPDRQDGLEAAGLGRLRHAGPRRLGAPIKSPHVSHDNFRYDLTLSTLMEIMFVNPRPWLPRRENLRSVRRLPPLPPGLRCRRSTARGCRRRRSLTSRCLM